MVAVFALRSLLQGVSVVVYLGIPSILGVILFAVFALGLLWQVLSGAILFA